MDDVESEGRIRSVHGSESDMALSSDNPPAEISVRELQAIEADLRNCRTRIVEREIAWDAAVNPEEQP